jgi:hypothetical protein
MQGPDGSDLTMTAVGGSDRPGQSPGLRLWAAPLLAPGRGQTCPALLWLCEF